MKILKRSLVLLGVLSIGLFISACGKKKTTKNNPTSKNTTKINTSSKDTTKKATSKKATSEKQTTEAKPKNIDPERAMANLINKLSRNNYVMSSEKLVISVCDENLVYFDSQNELKNDWAAVSVDGEIFQLYIDSETGIYENDTTFVEYGKALEVTGKKFYTLNGIIDYIAYYYNGNVWDMFTNDSDNPGTFTSDDQTLKYAMLMISDYPKDYSGIMGQVTMTFDEEDPTEVHLIGSIPSFYINIDIKLTFGDAVENAFVNNWMKEPIYPEAKTNWDEADLAVFATLFYTANQNVIPFVDGISYAFYEDYSSVLPYDFFYVNDRHADVTVYNDYITKIKAAGYQEYTYTDENGNEYDGYRLLIKPDSKGYAFIQVEYDYEYEEYGIELTISEIFDTAYYYILDEVNDKIEYNGMIALPTSYVIDELSASDVTNEYMDSIFYLFDYDLVLYVDIIFETKDDAESFFDTYKTTLLNSNNYYEFKGELGFDDVYYATLGETKSVRYKIDNNCLHLKFKAEVEYSTLDINSKLHNYGFETIEFDSDHYFYHTAGDRTNYRIHGEEKNVLFDFDLRVTFKNVGDLDNFLDAYVDKLTTNGYTSIDLVNDSEIKLYSDGYDGVTENNLKGTYHKYSKGQLDVIFNVISIDKELEKPTDYAYMVQFDFIKNVDE